MRKIKFKLDAQIKNINKKENEEVTTYTIEIAVKIR